MVGDQWRHLHSTEPRASHFLNLYNGTTRTRHLDTGTEADTDSDTSTDTTVATASLEKYLNVAR